MHIKNLFYGEVKTLFIIDFLRRKLGSRIGLDTRVALTVNTFLEQA